MLYNSPLNHSTFFKKEFIFTGRGGGTEIWIRDTHMFPGTLALKVETDWLLLPPSEWMKGFDFNEVNEFVKTWKVVNDGAEWGNLQTCPNLMAFWYDGQTVSENQNQPENIDFHEKSCLAHPSLYTNST